MIVLLVLAAGAAITGTALAAPVVKQRRNSREEKRQQRRNEAAHEERTRQERLDDAERRLGDRVAQDPVGAASGLAVQEPWASERLGHDQRARRSENELERCTQHHADLSEEMDNSKLPSSSMLTLIAAIIWAGAAGLLLWLDYELIHSLGYSTALSLALSMVVMVINEALGLAQASVLGLHRVTAIENLGRQAKVVASGLIFTVLAVLVVAAVIPLAQSRANNELMPRIDAERVELAAAQSGAVAVPDGQNVDDIIKAREAAIDRLTNQLNSAQRVDIAYTIAAVAAVFAFSWAPMHFAAHRQLRRAERRKNAAEAERDAAIEAQEAFTSRITTRLAEAADFAGHDPNSVNRPPTGPAPIAPPPRPDPPRRPHAATRPDDEASRIAVIDDFQTDPPAGHPPAGPDLFDQFPKGDT